MNDPKVRKEIDALIEALDDAPISEADGREAVERLNVDVKVWARSVRERVADAEKAVRSRRFEVARQAYTTERASFEAKRAEPKRSLQEQRSVLRELVARVPRESATAVHFHKFDEASAEELAEMIKALRHLLGEDDH